jgi:hypothetical protein
MGERRRFVVAVAVVAGEVVAVVVVVGVYWARGS